MSESYRTDAETRPMVRWLSASWSVATSPVTFVVLSILWCLDLAAGSIVAYRIDPRFWVKMDSYPFNVWLERVAPRIFPESLWVYVLVVLTYLVVLSLILCTLNWFFRRRRRMRGMGEVLVHLGFLLVFAGFVLGSGFGTRTQGIPVPRGESVPVEPVGLSLQVDDVDVVRGPGGQPLDTVSRVALLEEGRTVASGTIRTNHPLIWGTTVVYPQSAQIRILGARVAVLGTGVRTLRPGHPVPLPEGRFLTARTILQAGERGGSYVGPGILIEQTGADGRVVASGFLSPARRDVVDLAGVRMRLVDLEWTLDGIYNVHRDPGILLVLAGALILTLGTFWALAGYLGITGLQAPP